MRAAPSILLLGVTLAVAAQASPCDDARLALDAATASLGECLDVALGDCEAEQAARDQARAILDGCADPGATTASPPDPAVTASPLADPTPSPAPMPTPAPAIPGTIAVVVDGASAEEQEIVGAATRLGLAGATLVDSGVVRAARAFLGSELDDATAAKLRQDLTADRLLVLQLKAAGASRFVSLRVFDTSGTAQRFAEATAATLPDVVRTLVAELPPPAAPVPEPTPIAFAPTPTATPTPEWTEPPLDPHRPSPRPPPSPYVDIGVFGGHKALDTNDWAPLASHGEVGLMTSVGAANWPVFLAGDYYYSFASGTVGGAELQVRTTELCVGLRRSFDLPTPMIRPHLDAGLGYITVTNSADFNGTVSTVGGSALGFWAGGGATLRLGSSINLGMHARYSVASPEVNGRAVNAGGFHVGATIGFGYGASSPSPSE